MEARVSLRQCSSELQAARGLTPRPEIFGPCQSKAVEDPCRVSFVKLWAGLHKFEGLGRGSFERSWPSLGARGRTFGVDFPGFCRSGVDGSSGGIGFVKFFLDLHRLEWETREFVGNLWPFVVVRGGSVVDDFFWVLYIKVLRRFLCVDFLWNLVRSFRNLGWESAGLVELVAILVYIVILTLAALTEGWQRLDLRVKREMVRHHFFVSLSFIFKLRCRLPWLWMHLNLQNLTLSSINLYIRPSGACIELYKLSLSGWNNTISVEKLCFFFFFFLTD